MCRIETFLTPAPAVRPEVAPVFPESSNAVEATDAVEAPDMSDWQTVPAKRRGVRAKPISHAAIAAAAVQADADPGACDGSVVDLYYDRKELFYRGWQSGAKQPRSVKQKRRTEYQVSKRRDQSTRDRASMFGGDFEGDGDC